MPPPPPSASYNLKLDDFSDSSEEESDYYSGRYPNPMVTAAADVDGCAVEEAKTNGGYYKSTSNSSETEVIEAIDVTARTDEDSHDDGDDESATENNNCDNNVDEETSSPVRNKKKKKKKKVVIFLCFALLYFPTVVSLSQPFLRFSPHHSCEYRNRRRKNPILPTQPLQQKPMTTTQVITVIKMYQKKKQYHHRQRNLLQRKHHHPNQFPLAQFLYVNMPEHLQLMSFQPMADILSAYPQQLLPNIPIPWMKAVMSSQRLGVFRRQLLPRHRRHHHRHHRHPVVEANIIIITNTTIITDGKLMTLNHANNSNYNNDTRN